ncbi:hypothetical protein [Streptomyces sp. 8N706]|uniref:hypothetical protein n=1 Tax=Streptomyces sp. 8N706 TaxID=3457416 RepID=UPI003FCF2BAB
MTTEHGAVVREPSTADGPSAVGGVQELCGARRHSELVADRSNAPPVVAPSGSAASPPSAPCDHGAADDWWEENLDVWNQAFHE